MNKISQYFSTFEITRGLAIALLSSGFIYLNYWGLSHPFFNTILGLSSLLLLLQSKQKVWLWYGVFIGLFWFWWISLSLVHYGYQWAFVLGLVCISLMYGLLYALLAWFSERLTQKFIIFAKALSLLILSYIHPFGFDWLKPELMFVESYLGIHKWQFAIILLAMAVSIFKKNMFYLLLILFAYQPIVKSNSSDTTAIKLITTKTSVKDKWDTNNHPTQFKVIFSHIESAIKEQKRIIVLPESVFPLFLNHSPDLMLKLKTYSKDISIITGGLYWNNKTPYNSTYIFVDGDVQVANKVLLVPFGESNPLPNFMSKWINDVFYDGAIDYVASTKITDYSIDKVLYRNAICFEATSEKLYQGKPKNMIVLSNNGWFTPSTEPTLQKLLLQYYSKKYGTSIYHSINMSDSYSILNGQVFWEAL